MFIRLTRFSRQFVDKGFKPLIQAPVIALVVMLNGVAFPAISAPTSFDPNSLQIVITPDFMPIIWRHAQNYGTDFEIDSVYDEGVYACSTYCPQAAVDAGAVYYKEFQVSGDAFVTAYYDENGNVVGTSYRPDSDGDGVPDDEDAFPDDPYNTIEVPQCFNTDGGVPGYQVVNVGGNRTLNSPTGLVDGALYLFGVAWDGGAMEFGMYGQYAPTYGDLIDHVNSEINADQGNGNGPQLQVVAGNLRVVSPNSGNGSEVWLTAEPGDSNIVEFLSGYIATEDPVSGQDECDINTPPAPDLSMPGVSKTAIDQTLSLDGQFDVSPGGQATYEIPIEAPPGSGGLTPNMSLRYNSGAGNGMAGWGWSISGLGSISRCRQTEGHDKNAAPITWSAEDRFCLNGKRLLVMSGIYGEPGSTYRTEIDSNARITAIGGTTGHPDYFKVERKDGRVDYYGSNAQGTAGSSNAKHRMIISNVRTYRWLLSRQEDSTSHMDGQGNHIRYTYHNGTVGAQPRIQGAVAYHGSTSTGGVYFAWEPRPDKIQGFIAGHSYHNDYRLEYIDVSTNGDTVRGYNLNYDESEVEYYDRTSRLMSVDHCPSPDSPPESCSRGTAFDWNKPRFAPFFQHSASTSLSMFPGSAEQFTRGDINGDGLQDIIWGDSGEVRHSIASLDGNGQLHYPEDTTTGGHPPASPAAKIHMVDYNADGRQDLVVRETYKQYGFTPGIRVYPAIPQSDGNWTLSATPVSESTFLPLSDFYRPIFVDIDGNGLQDVVDERTGKYRLHDATQYGEYAQPQDIVFTHPSGFSPCATPNVFELHSKTGDFNGDGRMDFIGATNLCNSQGDQNYTVAYTSHLLPGGGLELRYFATVYESVVDDPDTSEFHPKLVISDLNNDGLSDVFDRYRFHKLSNGQGFEAEVSVPVTTGDMFEYTSLADVNADGYPDILRLKANLDRYTIRYWDPAVNSYSSDTVQVASDFNYGLNEVASFSDMNGDGLADVVLYHPTGGTYNLIVVPQSAPADHPAHRIHRIFEEGGNTLAEIRYENLGQSDHYSYLKGVGDPAETVCQDTAVGNACWTRRIAAGTSASLYDSIYDPFGSDLVYSYNQSLQKPLLDRMFNISSSMPVVTDVSRNIPAADPNNPGNISTATRPVTSYYYEQGRMQASGRGFLGFKRVVEVDRRSGVRTVTDYRQDWPFNGRPLKVRQYAVNNRELKEDRYIWGFADCYSSQGAPSQTCVADKRSQIESQGSQAVDPIRPFLREVTETRWTPETVDDIVSIAEKSYLQDDKGNTVHQREETWNGEYEAKVLDKTTTNQYAYSGNTWSMQQGRLEAMTVTSTNDLGSITRESSFTYYTSGRQIGLVETETIEPGNSAYTQTTTHTYDEFGNRTQSIVTGGGQTRYGPRREYDAAGRYVDRVYERFNNGAGDSVERLVSDVIDRDHYGTATQTRRYVDANNYTTEWVDTTSMGVPYRRYDSTGAWTVIGSGLGVDSAGVCPGGLTDTHKHIRTAGGGERILCFDVRNRKIRKATRLIDGRWNRVDTEYDTLGRVVRVSEPYAQSLTVYWTEHTVYDALNRVKRIEHPEPDAVTTFDYHWDHTVTTNPLGQVRKEYKNALGQVTRTVDPMDNDTWYTYDARGNLKTMTDAAGNTTIIGYDLLDRKTSMDDPDKGFWTYRYNHMGELTCQRDAKGQVIKHSYDFKGRLVSRKDYTGGTCASPGGTLESDNGWTYDTATDGLGQLDIVADSISGYEKQTTYDQMGRPSITRTRIPGADNQLEDHYEKVTYDQHGRVFQAFDAARSDTNFNYNGVQHVYKYGYLHKLTDALHANGQPLTTYYEVETVDRRGNVTEAAYGNGVTSAADYDPPTGRVTDIRASNGGSALIQDLDLTWDVAGNLLSRHEKGMKVDGSPRNLREDFTEYDALNRLRKHQLSGDADGTYFINYDAIGNITNKYQSGGDYLDYFYDKDCSASYQAGPHAICDLQIETPDGNTTNYPFAYDANGNQTSGNGRTIDYTIFDKPKTITKGNHNTRFRYGPDRARYQRTDQAIDSGQLTTTLYLGNVEKLYHHDGSIQWKRYIGGMVLIIQDVDSAGNILQKRQNYLYKDHLGNINAITNDDGDVIETLDYDPWGRRRDTQSWEAMPEQEKRDDYGVFANPKPETGRGFTGHEHLDEVGLIHMNGRIYDDFLGRFVQADPVIQDPYNSQSLNRYSYVLNNPLNATDPSGFESCASSPGGDDCPEEAWEEVQRVEDLEIDRKQHIGEVMANMAKAESMMRDSSVNVSIDGISLNSMSETGALMSFAQAFDAIEGTTIAIPVGISVYSAGHPNANVDFHYRKVSYLFNSVPMAVRAESGVNRGRLNQGGGYALKSAAGMTRDWLLGTGPADRTFDGSSVHSKQLMDAPGVNRAREFYRNKFADALNTGSSDLTGMNVTNYVGKFSISEFMSATINLDATEHFVGSYRVDIYGGQRGSMNFVLTNNSSFKSLAYGVAPAWERSSFQYMGNMRQTYTWTERCCGQ